MGITIHYNAEVKQKDKKIIPKILRFVEDCAMRYNYEYQVFRNLKGYAEHNKIFNQNNEISQEWFSFSDFSDEKADVRDEFKESGFVETDTRKNATQDCILIHNKFNGEYRSESFEVGFYLNPFNKKYSWSGFTKTQIFNEKETIPNLKFHIFIIKILEQIKLRFLPELDISDEAHFFFTEQEREENIKSWEKSLKDKTDSYHDIAEKYLKEWKIKKPYDFRELVKAHTGNLSLIKSIGGTLQGLGYKKGNIMTPVENGDVFLKQFYNKICKELGD